MKKRPSSVPSATLAQTVSLPEKFKLVRQVTLPLLKWTEGVPRYLRFDGEIHESKQVTQRKGAGGVEMKPARIANVTCLETKSHGQIIVGDVLEKRLNEEYSGAAYVGKCFQLVQHKVEGKRYKSWTIMEIAEA